MAARSLSFTGWRLRFAAVLPRALGTPARQLSSGEPTGVSYGGNEDETEEGTIVVDRSGLARGAEYYHSEVSGHEESAMLKHIKSLVRFRGGPITVAEYMEEVLTNPSCGYYMHRDVFGKGGDFVTSPDISQLYGEMIGVWSACLWDQMDHPKKVALIELGPGRGTLMADLLRGTEIFEGFSKALSVHLVECSPTLRKIQQQTLNVSSGISKLSGSRVSWHVDLDQVPRGVPTILIAHEFYDALPVHQFQKTSRGWCEKLVDIDESSGGLRFVLSPNPTTASKLHLGKRLKWASDEEKSRLQHIEISPQSLKLTADITRRIEEDGGGAVIIDYGDDHCISDSFQAIKDHQFVDVLEAPGTADLSAHVDFAAIRHTVTDMAAGVSVYGPITQSLFLSLLGIEFRLQSLLECCSDRQAEALQLGYWRIAGHGTPPWLDDDDGSNTEVSELLAEDDAGPSTDKGTEALPQDAAESSTAGDRSSPFVEADDGSIIDAHKLKGMGYRYKVLAIVQTKLGPPAAFD